MIKFKDVIKNKKLSNFSEIRPLVIANGKKYFNKESITKKKECNTTHLNEYGEI
jgi:hypothetical protein